jgi:CubicO group peptidase (beta-lactamase class C family)
VPPDGLRPRELSGPRPSRDLPWPEGDPSRTAAPEDDRLGWAVAKAFSEPDPRRLRRTRAVVVAQGGRLLAERYAPGFGPATPLPGWSMAKGVTNALVGILVGQGRLNLTDRALLPEWSSPSDPRSGITLDDLLRMRSGLAFSEVYSDPLSDVTRMLFASRDCAAYAAAKPLAVPPGSRWAYASGTTNILSRVMRLALGGGVEDALAFPARALFGPIGMSSAVFESDAGGTLVGSSFLYATARDWARLGWLYAQDGVWAGRRVLPAGWVGYSLTPTPQSPEGRYGAHWWLKLSKEFGGETAAARRIPSDAFFAMGHEGQVISVVPSAGLVAVRLGLSVHVDAWDHAGFLAAVLDALGA